MGLLAENLSVWWFRYPRAMSILIPLLFLLIHTIGKGRFGASSSEIFRIQPGLCSIAMLHSFDQLQLGIVSPLLMRLEVTVGNGPLHLYVIHPLD